MEEYCDSDNSLLCSESDICSLLHFTCFGSQITNSLLIFPNIFCYFLWNVFFNYGIVQERSLEGERLIRIILLILSFLSVILFRCYICHKFPPKNNIEYHKNLCWTKSNILSLAKMQQWHFLLTYLVTGSLRNDWKSDSIPPLGGPCNLLCSLQFSKCLRNLLELFWKTDMSRP